MGNDVDATKLLQGPQGGNNQKPVPAQQQHNRGRMASPLFLILMGLVLLGIGVSTSMFDIQATESLVSGVQITTFVPNWTTLGQPWQIISGTPMPANVAAAYYSGWIVEFASIILVVCFDLAMEAILHAPRWVVTAFRWSIYIIAVIDVLTNYFFEPLITAWWVRIIVAILIAVSSFFFPIVGVLCIERGVRGW